MSIRKLFEENSEINQFKNVYLDHYTKTLGLLKQIDIGPFLNKILKCHKAGGKIIFMGNGGSQANAQHLAVGLGFVTKKWNNPIRTHALGANSVLMSSLANDYGYDQIFKNELKVILTPHDFVVGLSVSGNSKNVVHALEFAREMGFETFALVGNDGGEILAKDFSSLYIKTDGVELGVVEDIHMLIGHLIGYYLEFYKL
jgi:D-sedoheptulose 7-phosphate isomerase